MTSTTAAKATTGAPIPGSFLEYAKSMGPGIVAVLTWLGAGDIVNSAMAGGNYGYALMWAFVLCLVIRYLFVSIVAKYQLCNQHGETVLGGLTRLHPWFAPFVLVCTMLLGHGVCAYLLTGAAIACVKLSGYDNVRAWAVVLALLSFMVAFRPAYRKIEKVFFVLVGILSVCFVSLAIWSGPSPAGIARGVFGFAVPQLAGRYDAMTLMLSMVGAVAGGLGNLMYPYFVREKGWITPLHRKVQRYDLLFGIVVMIVLDLAVWVVGAEILYPKGIRVVDVNGLAMLLGAALGRFGTTLFYVGILAALFSNLAGSGCAYSYLGSDAWAHWRRSPGSPDGADERRKHPLYRFLVAWIILSPLIWPLMGQSDFVALTLIVNAAQVVIIPVIVIGMWIITARSKYIGTGYRNRAWENIAVGFLFLLGCVSTWLAVAKLIERIHAL
jgi:Mn2+/Fe2+ NRAMP family transporter